MLIGGQYTYLLLPVELMGLTIKLPYSNRYQRFKDISMIYEPTKLPAIFIIYKAIRNFALLAFNFAVCFFA